MNPPSSQSTKHYLPAVPPGPVLEALVPLPPLPLSTLSLTNGGIPLAVVGLVGLPSPPLEFGDPKKPPAASNTAVLDSVGVLCPRGRGLLPPFEFDIEFEEKEGDDEEFEGDEACECDEVDEKGREWAVWYESESEAEESSSNTDRFGFMLGYPRAFLDCDCDDEEGE